jgi:hypothetical protein
MHQKLEEAKAFAQRHKVALACGAGIAVGVIVTRKIDTRLFTDFTYKMGAQAGVMSVHLDMAFEFIEEKGLWDEYLKYGPKFAETSIARAGERVTEASGSIASAL